MPSLLTVVGGLLRVNGCGGPLVLSPKPGGDEPCCCDECPTPCALSEGGLNSSNSGWSIEDKDPLKIPKILPISIDFKFEDASICGGSNSNVQSGNLSCCFFLNETAEIEIEVFGNVETQDSGYDTSTLSINGAMATIGSFNEGGGCGMKQTSDKKTLTLLAGVHTYTLTTSTNDPLYHVGMTHTFKISKK